MKKIWNSRW